MGKFFGRAGGVVFPTALGRFGRGEPMVRPVPSGAAPVPPEAMPVGNAVPYQYTPHVPMIVPELLGAPVMKSIVPPLWGDQTRASFLDRGAFTVPMSPAPALVPGGYPMDPTVALRTSPPPQFLTPPRAIAEHVDNANVRALIAAKISNETQAKADAAAHAAGKAFTKAQMAPSAAAAGDAAAKARAAELADEAAARARGQAAREQEKAQVAEEHARAWVEPTGFEKIDQRGYYDDQYGPPGPPPRVEVLPDGTVVPASHPVLKVVVPAGVGAAAGFAVAGPMGALIGAAAGFLFGKR